MHKEINSKKRTLVYNSCFSDRKNAKLHLIIEKSRDSQLKETIIYILHLQQLKIQHD